MPVISIVKVAGSVFDGPTVASHDSFRHPVKIPLKKEQQQRDANVKKAANPFVSSLFPSAEKEPSHQAPLINVEDAHEGTAFDAYNAKNLFYPSVIAESDVFPSYNVVTTATDAESCWGLPYRPHGIEAVWNDEDNPITDKKESEEEEEERSPLPLPVSVAPTSFTVSVVTPPPPPPRTFQPRTVPTMLRSSSGETAARTINSPIVASSSSPCPSAFRGLKPLYSSATTRDALKALPANAIVGLDEAMRVRHNPYAGTANATTTTAPAMKPPATTANNTTANTSTTTTGTDCTPLRYVNGRRLPPSIILRATQQRGVSGASMAIVGDNSTPSSSSNTSVVSVVHSVCSDRGGQKRPAAASPPPPPPSYKLSSNSVTQSLGIHAEVDAKRTNGGENEEDVDDKKNDARTMPATMPQLDASSIPPEVKGSQCQTRVEAAAGVGAVVALPHRVVSTVTTVKMERLGKRLATLMMAQHQQIYQDQLALLREQQQLQHNIEDQQKPSQQQQQRQQKRAPSVSGVRHHKRYSHDPYASMNATSSRRVFTVVAVPIAFSPATQEAVAVAQQVQAMLLRKHGERKDGDSGQLLSVSSTIPPSTDVSTITSDGGLPTPSPSYPQEQAMNTAADAARVAAASSEEDLEKTMSCARCLPPTSGESIPLGVAATGDFSSLNISNNCRAADGEREASGYPPCHQPSFVTFSTSGNLTQISAQTDEALNGRERGAKVSDPTSRGVVSEKKLSVAMPPPLPSLLRAGPEGTWDISSSLSSTIDEPHCAREEQTMPRGDHGDNGEEDCALLREGLSRCPSGVTYALDYVVHPSRGGSIDNGENKEKTEEPLDMLRAAIRGGKGGAGDCAGLVIEENIIEGSRGRPAKLNHGSSSVELLNTLARELHRASHAKEVKTENSSGPSTNKAKTTDLNQFTTRRNVRIVEIVGGAPAPSYPVRHCYFNVCAAASATLSSSCALPKPNTAEGMDMFSSSSLSATYNTPTLANAATCIPLATNHDDDFSYSLIAQFTSLAPPSSSQANPHASPHLVCHPLVTGCSVYSYREAERRATKSGTDNNNAVSVDEVRTEAIGCCSLETYTEKLQLLKVRNKKEIKEEAAAAPTTAISEDTTTEVLDLSPKTSLQVTQNEKKKSNRTAISSTLVPSLSPSATVVADVAITECLTPISSVVVSDTPVGQGTEGHGVLIANATKHIHIESKRVGGGGAGVNTITTSSSGFGANRSVFVVSRALGRTLASPPSLSSPSALTVPPTNETASDSLAKCQEGEDANRSRGRSCALLTHHHSTSSAATTATATSTPLAESVLALFQRAEKKREAAVGSHEEEGGGDTTSYCCHRGVRYYGLSSPLSSAISISPMPRRCLTYTPSSSSAIPPHFFANGSSGGVEGSAAHSNPRAAGVTSSPFPSGSVDHSRCETPAAATPPAAEIESLLFHPSTSSSYHCPLSKRAAAVAAAAMSTPIATSVSATPIGTLPHFHEKNSDRTQKQRSSCSERTEGSKEQQQHLSSPSPLVRTRDILGYGSSSLSLSLNNTFNVHEDEAAACGEIVNDTTTAKKNTVNKDLPACSSSPSMHSAASGGKKVFSNKSSIVTASSEAGGGGSRPSPILSRYLPRPTAVVSSGVRRDASPRRSNMYRSQGAMSGTSSSSVAEAMEAFRSEYTYRMNDTAVTYNTSRGAGTHRSTATRSSDGVYDHGLAREQILSSTSTATATSAAVAAIRGGGGVDGSCSFASSSFSPLSRLGTYTRNKARLSSYAN